MDGADPHGVKHRCNTSGGQFGIMGDQGGQMRPIHIGARLDMAFDIVGVQLDQTGDDEITPAIQSASGNMIPFGDLGNHALFDCYSPRDHPICQDKPRISEAEIA